MSHSSENGQDREIAKMEEELAQLKRQEKEVVLQNMAFKAHLDSLKKRIEELENHLFLKRQGQLELDLRPSPELT